VKNIAIYTCNFNNYDDFHEPSYIDSKVDYYYFTDTNYKSTKFNIRKIDFNNFSSCPQRAARYVKINSHIVLPQYEYTIWVDSSFIINFTNTEEFIKKALANKQIACYKHGSINSFQTCIYDEARVCIEAGLDNKDLITNQMIKYKKEHYPANRGLFSSGLIVRKNTYDIQKFNSIWWSEIFNGSKRDQLSQMYAAWKMNIEINKIDDGYNIYNNPYITKFKHIHKQKQLIKK